MTYTASYSREHLLTASTKYRRSSDFTISCTTKHCETSSACACAGAKSRRGRRLLKRFIVVLRYVFALGLEFRKTSMSGTTHRLRCRQPVKPLAVRQEI